MQLSDKEKLHIAELLTNYVVVVVVFAIVASLFYNTACSVFMQIKRGGWTPEGRDLLCAANNYELLGLGRKVGFEPISVIFWVENILSTDFFLIHEAKALKASLQNFVHSLLGLV